MVFSPKSNNESLFNFEDVAIGLFLKHQYYLIDDDIYMDKIREQYKEEEEKNVAEKKEEPKLNYAENLVDIDLVVSPKQRNFRVTKQKTVSLHKKDLEPIIPECKNESLIPVKEKQIELEVFQPESVTILHEKPAHLLKRRIHRTSFIF